MLRDAQAVRFPGPGPRAGAGVHADDAAVNVLLFVTPDRHNRGSAEAGTGGGLVVHRRPAPQHWDLALSPGAPGHAAAAVRAFLARGGEGNATVAYKCNRAVIFDANLFYETDAFDFTDTYAGWRTSLTLLYGERGRADMSQGLGMS